MQLGPRTWRPQGGVVADPIGHRPEQQGPYCPHFTDRHFGSPGRRQGLKATQVKTQKSWILSIMPRESKTGRQGRE